MNIGKSETGEAQRKVEGRAAFGASLSNAMLGLMRHARPPRSGLAHNTAPMTAKRR